MRFSGSEVSKLMTYFPVVFVLLSFVVAALATIPAARTRLVSPS
jgi:hypothetical protein